MVDRLQLTPDETIRANSATQEREQGGDTDLNAPFVDVDMTRVCPDGVEELTGRGLEKYSDLDQVDKVAFRSAVVADRAPGFRPSADRLHLFDLDHEFSTLQCQPCHIHLSLRCDPELEC